MPAKVTARIAIITVRVARAFFHSGGLKAGTPSEIASTPVSAAQPELKARRTTKRVSAPAPASAFASGGTGSGSKPLIAVRAIPTAIMTNMPTRKR